MYNITNNFLEYSRSYGREQYLKLVMSDSTLESEIISIEKSFDGDLYRTVMQQLSGELDGRFDLADKVMRLQYGLSLNGSEIEWVDYGDFIVKEHERVVLDTNKNKTTFIAYDNMLRTHLMYDIEQLNISYPISLFNLYKAIATVCGLVVSETSIPNGNIMVNEDKWTNVEDVTYRNLLDEISQITGTSIIINKNKLLCKEIVYDSVATNQNSIDESTMKSLKIDKKLIPFNILNLTREQAHDNYPYPLNWETIPVDERSEIIFADNQIMDKERDIFAPLIFPLIKDVSFTPFESQAVGSLHFQPLDFINVIDMNNVNHGSIVSKQTLKFTTGSSEHISSVVPKSHKEKYALVTDNKRNFMRVYFLVDQQNGIIEGLVQQSNEIAEEVARLTISVGKIEQEVENIHNGNIIFNLNGSSGYDGWTGGSELLLTEDLILDDNLTYYMGFVPKVIDGSESEYGLSFVNSGSDTSSKGFVIPDKPYSFRAKVPTFKPFSVEVVEYDKDGTTIKLTTFDFNNPMLYVTFTIELDENTTHVALGYLRQNVTPFDRLEVTEQMFNRGTPQNWFESANEAMAYARSTRTQLAGEIIDVAESVDLVNGKITNTTVRISGDDGVVIKNNNGKGLTVLNDNDEEVITLDSSGNVVSLKMTAKDMVSDNMVANNIHAVSGTIAGFNIQGNELVGEDISIGPNVINIGSSSIINTNETSVIGIKGVGLRIGEGYTGNAIRQIQIDVNGQLSTFMNRFSNGTIIVSANQITPNATGGLNIGQEEARYNNIFLRNQPNVSSDKRLKSNIIDIDKDLIKIFGENVKAKQFNVKHDDKIHFGYIAQDVEYALSLYVDLKGGNVNDYAMLLNDSEFMSLLYGEIGVIIEAYNRMQNEELNDRITKLEELLKER